MCVNCTTTAFDRHALHWHTSLGSPA